MRYYQAYDLQLDDDEGQAEELFGVDSGDLLQINDEVCIIDNINQGRVMFPLLVMFPRLVILIIHSPVHSHVISTFDT